MITKQNYLISIFSRRGSCCEPRNCSWWRQFWYTPQTAPWFLASWSPANWPSKTTTCHGSNAILIDGNWNAYKHEPKKHALYRLQLGNQPPCCTGPRTSRSTSWSGQQLNLPSWAPSIGPHDCKLKVWDDMDEIICIYNAYMIWLFIWYIFCICVECYIQGWRFGAN